MDLDTTGIHDEKYSSLAISDLKMALTSADYNECTKTLQSNTGREGNVKKCQSKNGKFQCDDCAMLFDKKALLVKHILMHLGSNRIPESELNKSDVNEVHRENTAHLKFLNAQNMRRKMDTKVSEICTAATNLAEIAKGLSFSAERSTIISQLDEISALVTQLALKSSNVLFTFRQSLESSNSSSIRSTSSFSPSAHPITANRAGGSGSNEKAEREDSLRVNDASCIHSVSPTAIQEKTVNTSDLSPECLSGQSQTHSVKKPSSVIPVKGNILKPEDFRQIRNQYGLNVFQCTRCQKNFKNKSGLVTHVMEHNGIRPYSCSICSRSFILKKSLQSHMFTHSEVWKIAPKIHEQMQGPTDLFFETLKKQIQMNQTLQTPDFGKTKAFVMKKEDFVMVTDESGIRNFLCARCQQVFKTKQAIERHLMVHYNFRPYECNVCFSSFRHRYNLKKHMATHRSSSTKSVAARKLKKHTTTLSQELSEKRIFSGRESKSKTASRCLNKEKSENGDGRTSGIDGAEGANIPYVNRGSCSALDTSTIIQGEIQDTAELSFNNWREQISIEDRSILGENDDLEGSESPSVYNDYGVDLGTSTKTEEKVQDTTGLSTYNLGEQVPVEDSTCCILGENDDMEGSESPSVYNDYGVDIGISTKTEEKVDDTTEWKLNNWREQIPIEDSSIFSENFKSESPSVYNDYGVDLGTSTTIEGKIQDTTGLSSYNLGEQVPVEDSSILGENDAVEGTDSPYVYNDSDADFDTSGSTTILINDGGSHCISRSTTSKEEPQDITEDMEEQIQLSGVGKETTCIVQEMNSNTDRLSSTSSCQRSAKGKGSRKSKTRALSSSPVLSGKRKFKSRKLTSMASRYVNSQNMERKNSPCESHDAEGADSLYDGCEDLATSTMIKEEMQNTTDLPPQDLAEQVQMERMMSVGKNEESFGAENLESCENFEISTTIKEEIQDTMDLPSQDLAEQVQMEMRDALSKIDEIESADSPYENDRCTTFESSTTIKEEIEGNTEAMEEQVELSREKETSSIAQKVISTTDMPSTRRQRSAKAKAAQKLKAYALILGEEEFPEEGTFKHRKSTSTSSRSLSTQNMERKNSPCESHDADSLYDSCEDLATSTKIKEEMQNTTDLPPQDLAEQVQTEERVSVDKSGKSLRAESAGNCKNLELSTIITEEIQGTADFPPQASGEQIQMSQKKERPPRVHNKGLTLRKEDFCTLTDENGIKRFQCTHCLQIFKFKQSLHVHIMAHNGTRPYKCSKCPKSFFRLCHLKKHLQFCCGDWQFSCTECPFKAKTVQQLREHALILSHAISDENLIELEKQTQMNKKKEAPSILKPEDFCMITDKRGIKHFQCALCEKTYKSKQGITRHIMGHKDIRPYLCNICNASYARKEHLRRHMLSHTGERPFSCSQCPFKTTTAQKLKEHAQRKNHFPPEESLSVEEKSTFFVSSEYLEKQIQMSIKKKTKSIVKSIDLKPEDFCMITDDNGKKLFKCTRCQKTVQLKQSLRRHIMMHKGLRPYMCNICPASYRRKEHLRRHMASHSDERPYACNHCSFTAKTPEALRNHLTTHAAPTLYACNQCSFSCRSQGYLNRHLMLHQIVPSKCAQCGRVCKSPFDLREHVKTHKRWRCKRCEFSTGDEAEYARHQRMHWDKGMFCCELCGFFSKSLKCFKYHMQRHENKTPFQCDQCDYKCSSRASLHSHKLKHAGLRPYLCSVCGADFDRSSHLNQHMLIHKGVKPHKCSQCNYRCSNKANLREHEITHTGVKPYKCKHCNASFRRKKALLAHIEKHGPPPEVSIEAVSSSLGPNVPI